MPDIPIADLVFKDPTVRAGVKIKSAEDLERHQMPVSDFDFRVASERPGESKPVRLDERFYSSKYPGLPEGAAFALVKASQGMKAKQIRSEWKKAQKKLSISSGHKIVSFE